MAHQQRRPAGNLGATLVPAQPSRGSRWRFAGVAVSRRVMRVQHLAAAVVCAAFLEVAFLACQAKSYSPSPTTGDDAGDANAGFDSGLPPLDAFFPPIDAFTPGDGAQDTCSMTDGAYTETLTWQPDAGEGDSGAACQSKTATFDYPPPFHPPNDGSTYGCVYTQEGSAPICSIHFNCKEDDGTYTTLRTGDIQVFNGTYGGHETDEVLLDGIDGGALFLCEYQLDFTHQ